MNDALKTIQDMLIRHEGLRLKPYRDTEGLLTIGVGRCLDRIGISRDEAMYLFKNDFARVWAEARTFPWFDTLDDARQGVVVNMIFNLGLNGFSKFVKTIAFIRTGQYDRAAAEMLDSKWAKQVGGRAVELAAIMRDGRLP